MYVCVYEYVYGCVCMCMGVYVCVYMQVCGSHKWMANLPLMLSILVFEIGALIGPSTYCSGYIC